MLGRSFTPALSDSISMNQPTMHTPLYDSIGQTYRTTRHADPEILNRLALLVGLRDDGRFIDLACGTGNYTVELAALGGVWHGVDISSTMLTQAAVRSTEVAWQQEASMPCHTRTAASTASSVRLPSTISPIL